MDLGFRISDYLCVEGSEHVVGTFPHRKDNPWDIVLLTRSGPRFHHGGYVVEAVEDIIRACDVAGNLGFGDRIEHGPGRHGYQHRTSLRARSGRASHRAAPARHPDHRHRRRADALRGQPEIQLEPVGLPAPRSWVEEASNFSGVEIARRPPVEGEPMTAEKYLAERRPEAVVS